MSPTEIIERANEDGLLLALSPSGSISVKGSQLAVDRWLHAIRQSKAAISRDNPGIRNAIEVIDVNTDPVIVALGIRSVAAFEINIPQAYYDVFALLELIEKHIVDKNANA